MLFSVLNEHSYPVGSVDRATAAAAVAEFVQAVRQIRRCRKDSVLVTEKGLFELELAPGYTFGTWAADNRNRDAARYLRSLRQRAPFQGIAPGHLEGVVEYHIDGNVAYGLGLAHLLRGLGVSLCADDRWRCPTVELARAELREASDGSLVIHTDSVEVRHVAMAQHVAGHERWMCDEGLAGVHTGRDLWAARMDLFPLLEFLPRVEDDMVRLPTHWIEPVKERLAELELATARWDTSTQPTPHWASHVTGESATRRSLCYFRDLDGETRLFETHARFTPGAGRLHFRIDRAKQRLVVAYVGAKLTR